MKKLFKLTNINLNSFNSLQSAKSVDSLINSNCDYAALRGEEPVNSQDNRITS